MPTKKTVKTNSGRVLTDAEIEALAGKIVAEAPAC